MFKKNKPHQEETAQKLEEEDEERVFNFTMGNVENSVATLFDDEFNSLQVYEYLLPKGLMPGQILTVTFKRNRTEELERKTIVEKIHRRILQEDEFSRAGSILK